MARRLLAFCLIVSLVLLGACKTAADDPDNGNGNGAPPLGQADIEAVVDAIGASVVEVGTDLIEDPILYAMIWFDPACLEPESNELKRGVFEFDWDTGEWMPLPNAVDYLECRWSFEDSDFNERDAVLRFDWGLTEFVGVGWGPNQEVPADGMAVTMTIDDVPAGEVDAAFAWYSAAACPDGVLVPTSVEIDGSMGLLATLSFNDVVFTLSDTRLATSGAVVAASGSDNFGIEWDVGIDGLVIRGPDCFVEDFDISSGDVSLTAFAVAAGSRSSLGFNLAFDNIVLDNDWLESIDISGSVEVNDVPAVTFSGTLDDLDEFTPGANVALEFADGTSMTLKEFIEGAQVMATTVSRLRSLVR